MKTSCFIGLFHRFDHSSIDGFEHFFLKIAARKFSKYIIRETATVLAKANHAKVVSVTEISEEHRVIP